MNGMSLQRLTAWTVTFLTLGGPACAPQAQSTAAAGYAVEERSIDALQEDLAASRVSSEGLVAQYLARIRDLDHNGPALRSVLALNPRASDDARRLDAERARGQVRGPLHGIPLLIKDNIETADPLATTAGSLALQNNLTGRDAPIIARLREAGAIVLGKTNLSEWANFRSTHSTSGWSAVGGLTRNPYALDRNACGSSSGSGAAVAANLAAAAIGTETDGSVTCPASINGIVGLKPTVGLLSRRHIVPITSMQDTAGPMARSVADVATLLTIMAGSDAGDAATASADQHRTDYAAALSADGLKRRRLGIMRFAMGYLPDVDTLFKAAVEQLKASGAEIVVVETFAPLDRLGRDEMTVLLTDFRKELNDYLRTTPPAVTVRTLQDLIRFNQVNADRELTHFGQELLEQSERTAGREEAGYAAFRQANRKAAGPDGIDALLKAQQLDALIAPTTGPSWTTDLLNGDHLTGGAGTLPAIAGYPHLTVPMGFIRGLPVGLSFIGPAWSESQLLSMGYAYEQRTRARKPPALKPTVD
jgi:amidase